MAAFFYFYFRAYSTLYFGYRYKNVTAFLTMIRKLRKLNMKLKKNLKIFTGETYNNKDIKDKADKMENYKETAVVIVEFEELICSVPSR